jgi:hypothetical protein
MKQITTTAAAGALAALALVATGALGKGVVHGRASDHVKTIHLISKGTSAHLVDTPPAATDGDDLSPGDAVIFTEDLRAKGHKVGGNYGVCTWVVGSIAQCEATLQLDGGKVVAAGTYDFAAPRAVTLAVTGGTGSYRGSRGTLRLKHLTDDPVDTKDLVLRIVERG